MCSFMLLRCAYFRGHDDASIAFFFPAVVDLTADQLEFLAERDKRMHSLVRSQSRSLYVHLIND